MMTRLLCGALFLGGCVGVSGPVARGGEPPVIVEDGREGAPAQHPPQVDLQPLYGETGAVPTGSPAASGSDPFTACNYSLEFMTGAYFAPTFMGPTAIPSNDFLPQSVRLGRMLTDPWDDDTSLLRGNLEGLLEATVAPIVTGPGNVIGATSALIRYNFVQRDAVVIPYFQAGAGMALNDIYKDPVQHGVGEEFEFLLQFGIGAHYMVTENWALNAEANFMHISNAGIAARNLGLNASGASLGFTYFYNRPR